MNATPSIDFHTHILHEDIVAFAEAKGVNTGFGMRPNEERPEGSRRHRNYELQFRPDVRLAEMDRRKIDIHVLSSSTVLQGTSWAPPEEDARLCRVLNDKMAEWVAYAPTRFVGSIVLPLQDRALALAELERCRATLGLTIVNAPACVKGVYLGDRSFDEYWSFVNRHRMTTFIHPDGTPDLWFQNFSLWNSIGQPIEETKVVACLIYEGVLDRFPDAPIVVSHGGGYLPLFMGRLDRNVANKPDSARNIKGMPSDYLRRLYFDTCVYDPATLRRLVETVGADRVLLGSDFPVGDADTFGLVNKVETLSPKERADIISGNAHLLLAKH